MTGKVSIFWFRRDLRIEDNAGLFNALKSDYPVQPVFIFDTNILEQLESDDARVEFIHKQISRLNQELKERNASLDVRIGKPLEVWKDLMNDYTIGSVFLNNDYEPYARERDEALSRLLSSAGISYFSFKDHVIFEKDDVLKPDGKPYTVYTPYSKKWKARLCESDLEYHPSESVPNWNRKPEGRIPTLNELGFTPSNISFPSRELNEDLVRRYSESRDYPALNGTSKMGVHLRFGTVSTGLLFRQAIGLSEKYLNELIWREFYISILWHFPRVAEQNFNRKYDSVIWRNDEEEFKKWCEGQTGYPIVDAGMRELNSTGYMHNRVRMIVASFLTKHLLIDWKWGETYFAQKLLDFELANNNGGWQWAAGTGVDAAPYFRIFNPYSQATKFDPDHIYIRRWVPEFGSPNYPAPMVDHSFARQRALDAYKSALSP